ncbi:hypothetical protein [Algirhabdus cladophorae]|uniref:hypothetical protein n=1 Tax=Algirhabdus cladophorae TaxID=3377108 RepID=UPI003B845A77
MTHKVTNTRYGAPRGVYEAFVEAMCQGQINRYPRAVDGPIDMCPKRASTLMAARTQNLCHIIPAQFFHG